MVQRFTVDAGRAVRTTSHSPRRSEAPCTGNDVPPIRPDRQLHTHARRTSHRNPAHFPLSASTQPIFRDQFDRAFGLDGTSCVEVVGEINTRRTQHPEIQMKVASITWRRAIALGRRCCTRDQAVCVAVRSRTDVASVSV